MEDNIYNLYAQLKYGQKTHAQVFIANECDIEVTSFRNHHLPYKTLPKRISEGSKKMIVEYLQNMIRNDVHQDR